MVSVECTGAMDHSDDAGSTAAALILRVSLADGDTIVTPKTKTLCTPSWAMSLSLEGDRDYEHIFRLPNKGGWIRKWVYSRAAHAELLPEAALANSTTESTTVYRANPSFGTALPTLSTHWFLCPYQSCNGYTVGLAFMDVSLNRLDALSIHPVECGRFAMDEASGEVFMTAYRDGGMCIAWTQSISSCERVREILVFEAPPSDGIPPTRILLRNSFYERRDCRLCLQFGARKPPCRAPAARARALSRVAAPDYLFPLQTAYRRFRGSYYGTVVKTRFSYPRSPTAMCSPTTHSVAVPIILELRHGIASIARRLKLNLRQSSFSFGVDPRVSQRMLLIDGTRAVSAAVDSDNSAESSECSARASPGRSAAAGDAKRIRNADGVLDRDSILHQRKVRNRESAARTNEARKKRILANKAELEHLKCEKLPNLKLREQQLIYENRRLKEMLSALRAPPDDRIDIDAEINISPFAISLDFPEDVFISASDECLL